MPAKTAPAAGRPVEKPAARPSRKTTPKLALNEALARVPRKYWITLGVLSLALAVVWGFSSRGAPSPEQLTAHGVDGPR